ncbi:MAG: hypothetical protein R6U25_01810, partial [Alkalispirochaeta sp.]
MTDIRLALGHRRGRLVVLLRHTRSLLRLQTAAPASRQARQDRYLWSRLFTLHRNAPRYELIGVRRLDAEARADRGGPVETPGRSSADATNAADAAKAAATSAAGLAPAEVSRDAVWELRLRGPRGIRHRVGDTVLVRWFNDPQLVEAVLSELGSLESPADQRKYFMVGHSSVFQPGRVRRLPLRQILEEELELYTAAPELQQRVAITGDSPIDQLTPTEAGNGRGVDLRTVLRRAAPAITPAELIRHQRRNTARAYSVSRIVHHHRHDEIEIIVSAVQTRLKQGEGAIVPVEGRATAWFRRLAETGHSGHSDQTGAAAAPSVFVQAWRLRHPWRLDVVGTRPMVIIVAGTGIAGVLAWLRDNTPKGPVWLIYGVRDWETRGLYQEELTRLVSEGPLVRLDVAASRSSGASPSAGAELAAGAAPATAQDAPAELHLHHRMRVNHVIESEGDTLRAMIAAGAGIYISGPRPMGEAARHAIMWALGEDASPDLLERWDAEGRLQ